MVDASGGNNVDLRYDPLGRLYEIKDSGGNVERLLYDGVDLIAEYNGSGGMIGRYIHGTSPGDDPLIAYPGSSSSASYAEYLYTDRLGSIVAAFDRNGTRESINSYDEYGVPGASSSNKNKGRFRYTGQIYIPELGMYHYKARAYSPGLGRFMQTDPIGYGDGLNTRAYVANDPINFLDPLGLAKVCTTPTGTRIKKCVKVDADGDGDVNDKDLTPTQITNIASSFHHFIVRRAGRDVSKKGAAVLGGSLTDGNYVRAVLQIIGSTLRDGFKNSVFRIRYGEGDAAGRTDTVRRNGGPKYYEHTLFLDVANQSGNASSLARTVLHEFGHRPEYFGLVRPASDPKHQALDAWAREHLRKHGLDGKGCPPIGGLSIFGIEVIGPDYPGC